MLDSGKWKGNEIIPSDYYAKSISPNRIPDEKGLPCDYYGFQWWLVPYQPGVFYARGILGQYIIVIPSKKMVITFVVAFQSISTECTNPSSILAELGKAAIGPHK